MRAILTPKYRSMPQLVVGDVLMHEPVRFFAIARVELEGPFNPDDVIPHTITAFSFLHHLEIGFFQPVPARSVMSLISLGHHRHTRDVPPMSVGSRLVLLGEAAVHLLPLWRGAFFSPEEA